MKLLRGFRKRRCAYILIDEDEAGYGGIQRDILSGLKGGGGVKNRVMDDGDIYVYRDVDSSFSVFSSSTMSRQKKIEKTLMHFYVWALIWA